jgi:DNA replication protein DnaC
MTILPITYRLCASCGTSFEAFAASFQVAGKTFPLPPQLHCDQCCADYDALLAKASGPRPASDRAKWETIAPKAYQGFLPSMLPESSLHACDAVLRWSPSPRGYGLSGASRSGKTFILTELMRRRYELGDSVHMPTASEFAYSVGSGHDGDRREMIAKCLRVDLLFIDDIGNCRYTDRVEKDLFHVLETRKRNLLPVFCTVNGKGADLAATLSEHSAVPIVNRLRHDVCEFIAI